MGYDYCKYNYLPKNVYLDASGRSAMRGRNEEAKARYFPEPLSPGRDRDGARTFREEEKRKQHRRRRNRIKGSSCRRTSTRDARDST